MAEEGSSSASAAPPVLQLPASGESAIPATPVKDGNEKPGSPRISTPGDDNNEENPVKLSPRKKEVAYETEKLFEMEDPEGLGDDWMTTPYKEPSLDEAIKKGLKERFMAGKADFFNTSIVEMGSDGIGVCLYFLILRSLATIFLVMTIIALPSLIFNIIGAGVSPAELDSLNLALTTLGNQGLSSDKVNPLGGCIDQDLVLRCHNKTLWEDDFSGLSYGYNISMAQVKDIVKDQAALMPAINFYAGFQSSDVTVVDVTIINSETTRMVSQAERELLSQFPL